MDSGDLNLRAGDGRLLSVGLVDGATICTDTSRTTRPMTYDLSDWPSRHLPADRGRRSRESR